MRNSGPYKPGASVRGLSNKVRSLILATSLVLDFSDFTKYIMFFLQSHGPKIDSTSENKYLNLTSKNVCLLPKKFKRPVKYFD